MKKFFIFLVLLSVASPTFAAYTEFFVQTTGSNLNAGDNNSDAADLTYASGTWVASTGVFTPASGNPATDGVTVGRMVSVYPDGSSITPFVGRVTAVDATTITVSTTVIFGTAPTDGTSNRTLKLGGAWQGPNSAVGFPFGFVDGVCMNAAGDSVRVNMKGGTTYSVTAAMTQSAGDNTHVITWQGYTTTPGDGGYAVIDGGAVGTCYTVLTVSGKNNTFINLDFEHNGDSGSTTSSMISSAGGSENVFWKCIFAHARTYGIVVSGVNSLLACEAYDCDQANTASRSAISLQSSGASAIGCIAHHNSGSNAAGFGLDGSVFLINCISAFNGYGAISTADVQQTVIQCEFYHNTASGIQFNAGASDALVVNVRNSNFVHNGTYGIGFTSGTYHNGFILNCGFGVGTEANTSGDIQLTAGMVVSGTVNYTTGTTPWNDPDNGDFRIVSSQAINAGTAEYAQTYTASTWTGTVGYPDIGAAQHQETAGGGGAHSYGSE